MKSRIYVVATLNGEGEIHLVEATSKAAARNHIARNLISARYAQQADLVAYLAEGLPILKATADDEPLL